MTRSLVAVLAVASFSLQACFIVPVIDAFKKVGATEGDRMALLPKEVKKYGDALTWSDQMELMALVDESARATVSLSPSGRAPTPRNCSAGHAATPPASRRPGLP